MPCNTWDSKPWVGDVNVTLCLISDIDINVKTLFPSLQLWLFFCCCFEEFKFLSLCNCINCLRLHQTIKKSYYISSTQGKKQKTNKKNIKPPNQWCLLFDTLKPRVRHSCSCGHMSHFTWRRSLFEHSDFYILWSCNFLLHLQFSASIVKLLKHFIVKYCALHTTQSKNFTENSHGPSCDLHTLTTFLNVCCNKHYHTK